MHTDTPSEDRTTAPGTPRRRTRRTPRLRHPGRAAVAAVVLVACGLITACEPVPPGPVPPGTPKCDGLTPTIAGTAGDDIIRGTAGRDIIQALGGNDYVEGLGGSDTICGGKGKDTLHGGTESDLLDPGEDRGNIVVGGASDDIVTYQSFAADGIRVTLLGGSDSYDNLIREVEHVIGTKFGDLITGNNGPNSLIGGGGSEEIYGLAGNDMLYVTGTAASSSILYPGLGDDNVNGSPAGKDVIDHRSAVGGVYVDTVAGFARGGDGNDTLKDVDSVIGSEFNDTIITGGGADYIHGRGGADQIHPGGGDDTVEGGDGADHVFWTSATQGVQVDLADGSARGQGTDVLRHIEHITGSRFDDLLVGSTENDFIDGAAGYDTCVGNGGNDSVINCP